LTLLAKELLNVRASFISVVDAQHDHYLSEAGFDEPLASSRVMHGETFCHHVLERGERLVIADTSADDQFRNVPTVQSLGVAAYVGIPVRDLGGQLLGSFCVIDDKARAWTAFEVRVLTELAASAEREVALRGMTRQAEKRAADAEVIARQLTETLAELKESHWHIRRLNEFLVICATCQRISLTEADWQPLVTYLSQQGIAMSHGYCPTCFAQEVEKLNRG
jgi:GAF domain-containing protein